ASASAGTAVLAPTTWGTKPTETPVPRCTRPESGSSTPARIRHSVVLPVPLGPHRPMRSPRPMRQDTARSRLCPLYPFETSSSAITRRLPHRLDAVRRNREGYAHLTWLSVRIAVLTR